MLVYFQWAAGLAGLGIGVGVVAAGLLGYKLWNDHKKKQEDAMQVMIYLFLLNILLLS